MFRKVEATLDLKYQYEMSFNKYGSFEKMQIHHYCFNSIINFLFNTKYYISLYYHFVLCFIEVLSNFTNSFKEWKCVIWPVPQKQFIITQFLTHEVDEQRTRNTVHFSNIYFDQSSVTEMFFCRASRSSLDWNRKGRRGEHVTSIHAKHVNNENHRGWGGMAALGVGLRVLLTQDCFGTLDKNYISGFLLKVTVIFNILYNWVIKWQRL